jgi:hypothetical protein
MLVFLTATYTFILCSHCDWLIMFNIPFRVVTLHWCPGMRSGFPHHYKIQRTLCQRTVYTHCKASTTGLRLVQRLRDYVELFISPRVFMVRFSVKRRGSVFRCKGNGKAIPLQALTGPEGSRRLRLPVFKTIST